VWIRYFTHQDIEADRLMITLAYLSVIRFSGSDAGDFLHNQLSADVLALSPGESTFACYCEPRGRVLALMLVSRNNDDYFVIMSGSLASSIAKRLRIYVMRSRVDIEVMDKCVVAGLHSGDEPRVDEPQALPTHPVAVAVPGSDDVLLVTDDNASFETSPVLQDAWKLSELKRGIVWLCTESSGQFLPQMLGYQNLGAVNFRKGCYPGQEIVARTHYLGKVKRHPRLLCTTAVICPTPLDNIQIHGSGQVYDAVIVDCGHRTGGGNCLFVVTRMEPELNAGKIEYQGQIAPLVH